MTYFQVVFTKGFTCDTVVPLVPLLRWYRYQWQVIELKEEVQRFVWFSVVANSAMEFLLVSFVDLGDEVRGLKEPLMAHYYGLLRSLSFIRVAFTEADRLQLLADAAAKEHVAKMSIMDCHGFLFDGSPGLSVLKRRLASVLLAVNACQCYND